MITSKGFRRKFVILLIPIFLIGLFLFFQSTKSVHAALSGEGLTISPPISELTLKSGEKTTRIIRVTNPTDKLVEVYPRIMDFRAKGEGGEPAFYEASEETSRFSLSKWISFTQPKIALMPEQVIEFKYDINVPSDAESGGHYGALFFATEPPKSSGDENKVTLGSMIGSLILVKVPGQINEQGSLADFSANKFISLDNNLVFQTRVTNMGNIHFRPTGDITIKSMFGHEIEKIAVNEQAGNVLPDSVRKFENKWKSGKFLLGIYRANLHLTYGDSGKSMDKTLSFVIVPWWIVLISLLIFLTLIVIIVRWLMKRRKRKSKFNNNNNSGKVIIR